MDQPTSHSATPVSPYAHQPTPLAKIGGALGIAATIIGFAIFLGACAGYEKALALSLIPLLLAVPGFIITIVGGVVQKKVHIEDTHMLAAVCLTLIAALGGLLEVAAWQHWTLFR